MADEPTTLVSKTYDVSVVINREADTPVVVNHTAGEKIVVSQESQQIAVMNTGQSFFRTTYTGAQGPEVFRGAMAKMQTA